MTVTAPRPGRAASSIASIGAMFVVLAMVLLPVAAANAAQVNYWSGNHRQSVWKYSTIQGRMVGGSMVLVSDYHTAKIQVQNVSGGITHQASSAGGSVSASYSAQTNVKQRCWWEPQGGGTGGATTQTICAYRN